LNGHIVITPDVARILEVSRIEGMTLYLPPQPLARQTYEAVNKVLAAMGGTWTRQVKGHVFAEDPSEALDQALMLGYAVKERVLRQDFYSPLDVVDRLILLAEPKPDALTLEPSCGDGAIVHGILREIPHVDVCEVNELAVRRTVHRFGHQAVHVVCGDFLTYAPGAIYDRIVANPPFSKQQDLAHVGHMLDVLKPRGIVVSVMGNSITFRTDRRTQALQARLEAECIEHTITPLPDEAFKESGTLVRAVVLKAVKR
jgi:protein-L-isoaspartate O-methyltransferase